MNTFQTQYTYTRMVVTRINIIMREDEIVWFLKKIKTFVYIL